MQKPDIRQIFAGYPRDICQISTVYPLVIHRISESGLVVSIIFYLLLLMGAGHHLFVADLLSY